MKLLSFYRHATSLFAVLVVVSLACSEDDAPTVEEPKVTIETRIIRDIDFVKNQYFLFIHPDPTLNGVVRPWLDPLSLLPDNSDPLTREIQVWQSVTAPEIIDNPGWLIQWANAFVDTWDDGVELQDGADTIAAGLPLPGDFLPQQFRLLEQEVDYDFIVSIDDPMVTIGLILRMPVEDDRVVAVSYTNMAGDRIGGTYADYGIGAEHAVTDPDHDMILKLIKAPNQLPVGPTGFVWHYMMRNFYNLGLTWISVTETEIFIQDNTNRADRTHPDGSTEPYIRIFGLDRYNHTGDPEPDGLFDFDTSQINPLMGILQFPSLTPFAPDSQMVAVWTDGEFSFADSLHWTQHAKSRRMYFEFLTDPVADAYQYDIIIRVTHVD
jgi:hypothetical protein